MKEVDVSRNSVEAQMCDKSKASLDTVTLTPKDTEGKVGKGKHIICFFGRNTPYESRWRELSSDANNLGATVHAFNFSGMNQSTGNMLEFNDAVNCGIAQTNKLLAEGVHPDDIIFKGNCFGSAVATMVQQEYQKAGVQIRCINTNSYTKFFDVVASAVPVIGIVIEKILQLFNYAAWNPDISQTQLLSSSPYFFAIDREGDKTVTQPDQIKYELQKRQDLLEKEGISKDELKVPGFEKEQDFLDKHSTMYLKQDSKIKDAHIAPFTDLRWKDEGGKERQAWELVGEYIDKSNNYIKQHQQNIDPKAAVIPVCTSARIPDVSKARGLEMERIAQQLQNQINPPKLSK